MQTERITLPDHPDHPGVEQWADLRAVSTLRAGDRKAVNKSLVFPIDPATGLRTQVSVGFADDQVWALLRRVIVNWSYDLPLPVADDDTMEASLGQVPLDAMDVLDEATEPHREALDFSRSKDRTDKEPGGGSSA